MSKPVAWSEVLPRFKSMVLNIGFRAAAKRMRVGKSTLYRWFKGSGRVPGAPPIAPSRRKVAAMMRVLRKWESGAIQNRRLTPYPVWPGWAPRGTKPAPRPMTTEALRYR